MPRHADILFKGDRCGSLEELEQGGTRFSYASGWSADIACTLPAAQRVHETRFGLHPVFQHLGAEGWMRKRQARISHVDANDDLGLLLHYGRDCIGAISVVPTEVPPPLVDAEATIPQGRTISGVQRKVLAVKDGHDFKCATSDGPAPYLAKFNAPDEETLVRNELLSLRLAQILLGKDQVETFELATVADLDEIALLVRRFDRTSNNDPLRLEDFAQILSVPKGLDFSGKYTGAYEDIAEAIDRYSVRPIIDKDRFFRQSLFNAILGNCDAHLKNFSLLETPQGLRLSPVYDVVNTVMYQRYDNHFALRFLGERHAVDMIDRDMLAAFGLQIGLTRRAVDKAFSDFSRARPKAFALLQPPEAAIPGDFRWRFYETVTNAWHRILRTEP